MAMHDTQDFYKLYKRQGAFRQVEAEKSKWPKSDDFITYSKLEEAGFRINEIGGRAVWIRPGNKIDCPIVNNEKGYDIVYQQNVYYKNWLGKVIDGAFLYFVILGSGSWSRLYKVETMSDLNILFNSLPSPNEGDHSNGRNI